MDQFIDLITSNIVYLLIAIVISVMIIISIVKKLIKLLFVSLLVMGLYTGYLSYTDQKIPVLIEHEFIPESIVIHDCIPSKGIHSAGFFYHPVAFQPVYLKAQAKCRPILVLAAVVQQYA